MEAQRREEVQAALIRWAVEALRRWAAVPPDEWRDRLSSDEATWLAAYGQLLSPTWDPLKGKAKEEQLVSIFSLVRPGKGETVQPTFVPARPLALETLLPGDKDQKTPSRELWTAFIDEFGRLPEGDARFDTFTYLFYKYAWAVPCTYGEPGVSLYEEFKALATLVHASDGAAQPAEKFLLVGGDLPGIQSFVYTITSKGVAKGLRGRSFYLQLLSETMVRVILRELHLPHCNVVYSAGGNFKLLAPESAESRLHDLLCEINHRLLILHRGELSLAMGWVKLDAKSVADDEGFATASESLAEEMEKRKHSAFAELVGDTGSGLFYQLLFSPQGVGGKHFCDVCHVDLPDGQTRCKQCSSFEALASKLAALGPGSEMLVYNDGVPLAKISCPPTETTDRKTWEEIIQAFGYDYSFGEIKEGKEASQRLSLNSTNFLPEVPSNGVCHGFRFLANSTPRILPQEHQKLKEQLKQDRELQDDLAPWSIRNTTIIADYDATGIPRYGVLRMDADGMGRVFSLGLKAYRARDLSHTSALSAAIGLFFDGRLDNICREVAQDWAKQVIELTGKGKRTDNLEALQPYTIYAGGDDLFILGYWDVLPELAQRIHTEWDEYTNEHLTMSAGIALAAAKFPLYQAARDAGESLEKAKERAATDENGTILERKNACTFLGLTLGWEEMDMATKLAVKISHLLTEREEEGVPRSMLNLLGQAIQLYYREPGESQSSGRQAIYGRWMWMLAYGLSRLARRLKSTDLEEEVMALRNQILDDAYGTGPEQRLRIIQFLDLPVHWADYLTRQEERQ